MFNYIPEYFKGETADNEKEADAWYEDKKQPPHAGPPAARRGGPRDQRRGQGGAGQPARRRLPRHLHAAVRRTTSGSACRRCTTSSRSWPTWTSRRSPWRSGRPATTSWAASGSTPTRRPRACPASSRRARWRAACTAPTGSAATRSPTSSSSAGAPGSYAAEYVKGLKGTVERRRRAGGARRSASSSRPSSARAARTPTRSTRTSRNACSRWSASSAPRASCGRRSTEIAVFKQRLARVTVAGGREFNPGWHLALDLHSMLSVSEAVTLGALARKESRGGHTREDYPMADDRFGKVNMVIRKRGTAVQRHRGAAARDARRAQGAPPGEKVMAGATVTMRVWRGRRQGRRLQGVPGRGRRRAWWCWTSSTRIQATQARRPGRAAGTARPASAARAAPRSTASRGSCA